MIIAQRDEDIFLSDQIGIINLRRGSHHLTKVESALKFGYWEDPKPGKALDKAKEYEKRHAE